MFVRTLVTGVLLIASGALAKVQMNIYLMSKCPDYDNSKAVELQFDYIGELSNSSRFGVECLHGDTEYGDADTALKYILCQHQDPKKIGTYSQMAHCLIGNPTWLPATQCALGTEGIALLQNSVKSSRDKSIRTSLTFTLDGETRCLFNSGHWVAPEDGCPGGGSVPKFTESIRPLEKNSRRRV
ncbi:hypothetical protein GGI15_000660 [Coemansia interrupta]|uniref:Uncharacterized protein n=1 Tax=Coemansia interrupta TaxID=1126814 RepID=A0A9W8HJZ4_9FUNG|nr:hypothetical protein GGI15_000660 [Coemansia interrupta]